MFVATHFWGIWLHYFKYIVTHFLCAWEKQRERERRVRGLLICCCMLHFHPYHQILRTAAYTSGWNQELKIQLGSLTVREWFYLNHHCCLHRSARWNQETEWDLGSVIPPQEVGTKWHVSTMLNALPYYILTLMSLHKL